MKKYSILNDFCDIMYLNRSLKNQHYECSSTLKFKISVTFEINFQKQDNTNLCHKGTHFSRF